MAKFNLEEEYKKYLEKARLKEENMGASQRVETKRAFMAGFGQSLIILRDGIGYIQDENEAVRELTDLHTQVNNFWLREASTLN